MSRRTKSPPKLKLSPTVIARIATAREDLATAERELKGILESLPSTLRADKKMVSAALRVALDKLTDAKGKLESVLDG
jgi:hypothetical protein